MREGDKERALVNGSGVRYEGQGKRFVFGTVEDDF